MPTTVTGLVIFVFLLARGFCFKLVHERGPFAQEKPSALREIATIGLSSVVFNLLALGAFVLFQLFTEFPPRVGRLVNEGAPYAREVYVSLSAWGIGIVTLATLLALVVGGLLNQPSLSGWLQDSKATKWLAPPKGVRRESAWWKLLKVEHPDTLRTVRCLLNDGSSIQGVLKSLSPEIEETADREITLSAPLVYITPDGIETREPYGAAAVSARSVKLLYVRYRRIVHQSASK